MTRNFIICIFLISIIVACSRKQNDYPIHPVSFTEVSITDSFWHSRQETNRMATIPFAFNKCRETGRIRNFEMAGAKKGGKFCTGCVFDDSDVFKIIEGASYSLSVHPDKALEQYLDSLISCIGAAQEPDGYLYTARTIDPEHPHPGAGKTRWSEEMLSSHETYNAGHMYEAAVAHFQATGKRTFLDIAIKNADLMCNTFGHDKLVSVPGHQEIEIGLVKLYRVTGQQKYLDLAKFFLDARGTMTYEWDHSQHWNSPRNRQNDKPIRQQHEAYGHAVRATYMYSGMADVAALTGDTSYNRMIRTIWANVVNTKLYITGGIGAQPTAEEYGDNYKLPNDTAYNETCAAIANILWNYRMFLLSGSSEHFDIIERCLLYTSRCV